MKSLTELEAENRALRQRLADLEIVADFNSQISSTLILDAVTRVLAETVFQVTGAQACGVMFAHEQPHRCYSYRSDQIGHRIEAVPPRGCVAYAALCSGRTLIQPALEPQDQCQPCVALSGPQRSYIALPLMAGEQVAAVLTVSNLAFPDNAGQQAELLATLAAPAALAIHNAQLYRQLTEEKARVSSLEETIRRLFKTYMPEQVAEALMADPSRARPGGERREVTVLFADLEGFTALSERTPPEQVLETLNAALAAMAEAITAHGGTVDKFMGDGIMAIFNAPRKQADHTYYAIQTALDIQRRIADRPPWRVNLGLHTGEAVVGNVGSANLLNYTAIGDAVNLAKRLQEMARGGQILASEETLARVQDRVAGQYLGEQTVQGRQAPVRVYVVSGGEAQP